MGGYSRTDIKDVIVIVWTRFICLIKRPFPNVEHGSELRAAENLGGVHVQLNDYIRSTYESGMVKSPIRKPSHFYVEVP